MLTEHVLRTPKLRLNCVYITLLEAKK